MKNNIDTLYEKIDSMSKQLKDIKGNQDQVRELENSIKEAKSSYNNLLQLHNQYLSELDKNSKVVACAQKDSNLLETYKEKFQKAFEDCNKISDNVDKGFDNLSKPNNKLIGDNYFSNLINDFNNYLSNLSLTEICLVINITSSILILTCLVTIIFAVYGNYIITKFSLEKKYPKLAKIINVRYTLQHTYIFFNASLIVVTLIIMIIINFISLIN